jgi:hypothetical protein
LEAFNFAHATSFDFAFPRNDKRRVLMALASVIVSPADSHGMVLYSIATVILP